MDTTTPLRRIRRARGLTVERLAAMAHLASATVYRAERGEHRAGPTDETLAALAGVLGVPVSCLRHDQDADSPETARGVSGSENNPARTASSARESAARAK